MRLDRAHSIATLRRMASERLPRAVFDFFDGGAEDEVTLRRNRQAFDAIEFAPRVMVDVSQRRQDVAVLGKPARSPMIVAPTGLASLGWPRADVALARAAGEAGVPFVISTASSVRLEDIVRAAPHTRTWFQLYVYRDRALTRSLVQRARAAGCEALVLTADVPVFGQRERDVRNRLSVPLRPSARLLWDAVRCPRWTWGILRHGVPRLENFVDRAAGLDNIGSLASYVAANTDASVSWQDLAALREAWPGPIVLKGVLSAADAQRAVQEGFDALAVSNHGGRQLDHAPAAIDVLPEIVAAVDGRAEVFVDGGVRRGSDVAKALCLGARAVMCGRATLFGVAAGGQAGAEHALQLLRSELDRTLGLLGCPSADALTRAFLRA